MISFECDYLEGCHEEILNALIKTNLDQESGYGSDRFTISAQKKIQKACQCSKAEIFFLTGGTQVNQLVIDTMLKPYEGVLAVTSAHINGHEAGAVEFSGHKVLTLSSYQGKINPDEVKAYIKNFYSDNSHEHMVFPGMVYISHPTEYGTLYTAEELKKLSKICRKNHIHLFLDGARLGYGLQATNTDVTLPLIAELCDVFYIGGTKVGALVGEALVFPKKNNVPAHFLTQIKQHGALSAKGRLIGLQFDTLFTNGLYEKISQHAIKMAEEIKTVFRENGYSFYIDSPTNQQFIILENDQMKELEKYVKFGFWEIYDAQHTVVRFATSWATKPEAITELSEALKKIKKTEVQPVCKD